MFGYNNSLAARFGYILQNTVSQDWESHKRILSNKFSMLKTKFSRNHEGQNKEQLRGILTSKDELNNYAAENKIDVKPNYVIYGDTTLPSEVIKFLEIPIKNRTIEEVKIRDVEFELSKVSAKLRYGLMSLNDDDDSVQAEKRLSRNPFRLDSGTLRMSALPATSFQYNTRVHPPKLAPGEQELGIQLIKSEVLTATKVFCKNNCDNKDTLKNKSLSDVEVRGRAKLLKMVKDGDSVISSTDKSGKIAICKNNCDNKDTLKNKSLSDVEVRGRAKLLKMVKDGDIVISSTDKSGKIAIWKTDLYLEAAKEHLEKDVPIDESFVRNVENQANAICSALCDGFNLGTDHKQIPRCKQAMMVFDVPPPNVIFLAKDHKLNPQGRPFPKTRAVCGAKNGPISRVQNFSSLALNFTADVNDAPHECCSTELMKRGIYDTNLKIEDPSVSGLKTILMSLDVCALYPSISDELAENSIFNAVLHSRVKFENCNFRELTKIVRVFCSDEQISKHKLSTVVPVRSLNLVGNKLSKLQPTYLDGDTCANGVEKWLWRQEFNPSKRQKRTILALVLSKVTKWCMNHHVYKFNGQMYHQQSGTPIGLQIAVAISRIVMIRWDSEMMRKMININIKTELLLRYVDDVNIILRLTSDQISDLCQVDNPSQQAIESSVANYITEAADSIYPGVLIFEADYPSSHEDNRLPILDLACWVEDDGKVLHQFYKKEMATDKMLGPESGFSPKVIKNILLQEYLRRLLNCSTQLQHQQKYQFITRMNLDLLRAGHSERFISNLTIHAINQYEKLTSNNTCPYRSKEEISNACLTRPDSSTWFRKDGTDCIINIPPTPNQELLNAVKVRLDKLPEVNGIKCRVQQSYGRTIIDQLMTRDLVKNSLCDRNDCLICTQSSSKGQCKTESITYQIACNRHPCNQNIPIPPLAPPDVKDGPPPVLYRGETSRTGYLRGVGHIRDYRGKSDGSSLWRHTRDNHDSVFGQDRGLLDYRMDKITALPKALDRLAFEGQIIQELEDLQTENRAVCLNSKLDFRQSHSVTLNFNSGAKNNYSS